MILFVILDRRADRIEPEVSSMILSPSALHRVTTDNFEETVLGSAQPVLLEMGAPWCGPCRRMQPLLAHLAACRDDVRIATVDLDENKPLANRFQITEIPTFMIFSGGELVERLSGELRLSTLNALIDRNK